MREDFEAATARIPTPDGVSVETVEVDDLAGEWVRPIGAAAGRAILYVHGGGYVLGSRASHRALVARIALYTGVDVLSIDYRRAPEDVFPHAVDDALSAWGWLQTAREGDDIAIVGDSAGGGLAVAAMVAMRESHIALPVAAVCLSPWYDLALEGASIDANEATDPQVSRAFLDKAATAYLGGADPRSPLASPLYADLSGLPPLLIQAGGAECLLDDARALAAAAESAGVDVTLEVWDDMFHVWHALAPRLPEAEDAIVHVGDWLQRRWSPVPAADA